MHSLFVRIFVLFWIAMALIVGGSIAITFTVAAREYESPEPQRRSSAAIQASEVLAKGGLPALKDWLNANKNALPDRDLFIVGPDGKDILGRRLSENAVRRLEFFNREAAGGPEGRPFGPPPGNFRPPHFAPQIVGPDGGTYTVLQVLRRPSIFGALSLPGISLTILCIALAVSAFASWWLAQHLSAPIRRIQEGARALASEKLDPRTEAARVSAGLEGRKDELAVLARDFDAMADQLRANRAGITRLLRDISHELRSPLARMRVAARTGAPAPADLPRQLERLEREIERLDSLISQVLKLARLQAPMRRCARAVRSRRGDRGSGARRELRRRRQELQSAARGRGKRRRPGQPRPGAKRHRERAAQCRALQSAGFPRGRIRRALRPRASPS